MGITFLLSIGLSILITLIYRQSVMESWNTSRCKPGVIPIAAFYKPASYKGSGTQFATENWQFCQKQYIESALRVATSELDSIADSQDGIVRFTSGIVDGLTSTFTGLWAISHKAYSMFMDRFYAAAKLMRKMMINMYALVDRLQGIVFSVILMMFSAITTVINSVQVIIITVLIIVAILTILQIILFYWLFPFQILINLVRVITIVAASTVAIATAVTVAQVAEAFTGQECFTPDTQIYTQLGIRAINTIRIGDILEDGGTVTAVHRFAYSTNNPLYNLYDIRVSGSHLIKSGRSYISVKDHPDSHICSANDVVEVICLTTTTRTIPVCGSRRVFFADWEEITDPRMLEHWYTRVFEELNGYSSTRTPSLTQNGGFSADSIVTLFSGVRVRASEIKIGDQLIDGKVLGIVTIEPSPMACMEGQWIAAGSWIFREEWNILDVSNQAMKPALHFYTRSGLVTLGPDRNILLRDASEVGLHRIQRFVDEIILPK